MFNGHFKHQVCTHSHIHFVIEVFGIITEVWNFCPYHTALLPEQLKRLVYVCEIGDVEHNYCFLKKQMSITELDPFRICGHTSFLTHC